MKHETYLNGELIAQEDLPDPEVVEAPLPPGVIAAADVVDALDSLTSSSTSAQVRAAVLALRAKAEAATA